MVVAFVCGVVVGGGTVWWWWVDWSREQTGREPVGSGASIRLVLSRVDSPTGLRRSDPTIEGGPLWLEAALWHAQGAGTVTVTRVHRPGRALTIRVPGLPLTMTADSAFELVRLRITPRDCALATQWTPSALPFIITWRDEQGDLHEDLGGDHDAAMEIALIRYMDAACGDPPVQ